MNREPTAYDTRTGAIPEYRGLGVATRIFEESIPLLKENGIKLYLLKVIQHNHKALSVYKKLGFEVTWEFNYFIQEMSEVKKVPIKAGKNVLVRQVDFDDCQRMTGFLDFTNSWQNSFDTIGKRPGDFLAFSAFIGGHFAGYCILEPGSGYVTHIAVDKNHRRRWVATALLHESIKSNRYDSVKIINTDVNCRVMTGFLDSINIPVTGKQ